MTPFELEVSDRIAANHADRPLQDAARSFVAASIAARYSYNFSWLGRPIIQYPQDIVAIQELVWKVRPDLVIETGIAHGGSLALSASLLALLDLQDAVSTGKMLDPAAPRRRVIGIDVDIRPHNRAALDAHPLRSYMELVEGSSVSNSVVEHIHLRAQSFQTILVILDSNHTHDHVFKELEAYAGLVTVGSYCLVLDTVVESLGANVSSRDRSWGVGDNPMTAAIAFVAAHPEFEVDDAVDGKLMISVAPGGYLKRRG